MDEEMMVAIREAWASLAGAESWRGYRTGWTATDLWTLADIVHETQPAAVVISGYLDGGGLPLYVGDLLDLNKRGKVLASTPISRELRRYMPPHRRVQYQNRDLTTPGGAEVARDFARGAAPVLLVATGIAAQASTLLEVVTVGGYFITDRDPAITKGFMVDTGRDPYGLSRWTWLMRVPA